MLAAAGHYVASAKKMHVSARASVHADAEVLV